MVVKNMQLWQSKLKAFVIHLALSALVIGLFMLVVTQIWYPGALFKLENVWQGLQILIPVDAILGPLLTLILFVPSKKNLKLDLSIIAFLQIAALVYGGWTIYSQRPAVIAFVVDRFEVFTVSEKFVEQIPMERFEDDDFPLTTYVLPPQSEKELANIVILGTDLSKIGERHYPATKYLEKIAVASLNEDFLEEKSKSKLSHLRQNTINNLILLPLRGSNNKSICVIFDSVTGKIRGYLETDPPAMKKVDTAYPNASVTS